MSPMTLNPALIPTGARKLVRALVLLSLAAAPAAAASPIWTQQQELTAFDGTAGDYFGGCISVSGDTAVIGAPGKNGFQGAAYVFVQSGGVWSLQQELTASDGAPNDQFGAIPSVSGDTALIAAMGKNGGQGAVYVFVRSGGVWKQQQELTASDGAPGDNLGYFVSVSGSTAVIAAPGKNAFQGAAYVFAQSGGTWSQQQKLTAADGAANDQFGVSVSVSGNTLLIGAPFKTVASNPNVYLQGAAYVFVESGGVWSLQQELTASDSATGDFLGYSVSVSGDTALVGAMNKNSAQGAAYVFMLSGTVWSQQQELTASDGSASNQFGYFVSLSGGMSLIGALGKTVNSNAHQGVAYVFAQGGGLWSQQQELTASDGVAGDYFGGFASVSGNTAVIGANTRNNDQGVAYVFTSPQPAITGLIVSGGGFNMAPNAWVEIYGASLAPPSVGADGLLWSSAPSFASGQMPTQLQGVSVTVNGKPAYVSFISATQVNVLTPLDSTTGAVAVTINNGTTTSPALTANVQPVSPGFLRFNDGIHIAAEHADYSLLGPASLSVPGSTFTPAKPGEIILLYGDGFGLPVSTITTGSDAQTGPLPTLPQVTIGDTMATVQYAGLISPGLYQINVVVPSTAVNGDNQVIATYAGASSPTGAMIPVSQ